MKFENSVEIKAAASRVWSKLVATDSWKDWTPSILRIEALDGNPLLRLGALYKISQPRLGTVVWKVTEFTDGKSFSWECRGMGMWTKAEHIVLENGETCRLILRLEQKGWFFLLFGWLFHSMTRKYIDWEAQGLKSHAEKP